MNFNANTLFLCCRSAPSSSPLCLIRTMETATETFDAEQRLVCRVHTLETTTVHGACVRDLLRSSGFTCTTNASR